MSPYRAVLSASALGALLLTTSSNATSFQGGDDDLSVVKRAVLQSDDAAPSSSASPAPRTTAKPQWLHIRVVEKSTKKNKVTVNMPLALVRALGQWPMDVHCGRNRRSEGGDGAGCSIRLSEVLDSLDAGQSLVEVDSDDETVRIWVE